MKWSVLAWRFMGTAAWVVLLLPGLSRWAIAQEASERILTFHSEIKVERDASMLVRETIKVRCAGQRIKRGIYRDFPTSYTDGRGFKYNVGFEVLEVHRDGSPEPYKVEGLSNGKRVRIGQSDVFLKPGDYTYSILYAIDRQIGFFQDHDELYWNATGNGWDFVIDQASATVSLPEGIQRDALLLDAYTGPQGSVGTAFAKSVDRSGSIQFATTRALEPAEGLTISVGWPKGFVNAPTREMKMQYFLRDNRSTIVGLAGFLLLLLYYTAAWIFVGRDPARGIIMPRYEPPRGLSPAAVRFLTRMGFDNRTFAAAIINMAVKRYLRITEADGEYTLSKSKEDKSELSTEEKSVASTLLGSRTNITLKNTNHATIRATIEGLKASLQLSMEKTYFFTNRRYLIPGLILSVLILVFVALAQTGESRYIAAFMSVWLLGWSVGVFFLLSQAINLWRGVGSAGRIKFGSLGAALFMTAFSLPFLAGEVAGLYFLATATSAAVIIILLVTAFANYLFHYLLKAPTHAGRTLMDEVEGFKMFLAATEKDRLNVLTPVNKTPALFEKYLPYALALDVEQEWSEQFSDVLAKAGVQQAAYSPAWYSGSSWRDLGASGFASSLGSSFSGAISSSSTAPGSSSGGGGGGSSGGGGGGGGGGGW
ncbi:MAG: DUF2207 domain-containing protein [Acidobacteria bacterium]|nr:DUF2207 domain-containing protein [Acidobacteriota bacterium]